MQPKEEIDSDLHVRIISGFKFWIILNLNFKVKHLKLLNQFFSQYFFSTFQKQFLSLNGKSTTKGMISKALSHYKTKQL